MECEKRLPKRKQLDSGEPAVAKKKKQKKSLQISTQDSERKYGVKDVAVNRENVSPGAQNLPDENSNTNNAETLERPSHESKQELKFYVGNLPGLFSNSLKIQLSDYFEEEGIEVKNIAGVDGNRYCHCTLTNPQDQKKMESLNKGAFQGSSLKIELAYSKDSGDKTNGKQSSFTPNVKFKVSNLPEPLSDILRKKLLTFFKKNGIELQQVLGRDGKWICHCMLAKIEDRDKMQALSGSLFQEKPLRIILKAANTFKGNEVTIYDVNYNVVKPWELLKKCGGQDIRINQKFGMGFIWFDEPQNASKFANRETLTLNNCEMRMEIKNDRHQSKKHLDYGKISANQNKDHKLTKATITDKLEQTLAKGTAARLHGNEVRTSSHSSSLQDKLKAMAGSTVGFPQTERDEPNTENEVNDGHHQGSTENRSAGVDFFIGNLPSPYCSNLKDSLSKHFSDKLIEILDIRGKFMAKCCHCTVNSLDREKLERLNGEQFQDKSLKIELADKKEKVGGKKFVLFDVDTSVVTAKRLRDELTGDITDAFVIKNKDLAFITFKEEADAKAFFSKGTLTMDDCEMRIDLAHKRSRKSRS